MLDEKKIRAIDYLVEAKHTKVEIAQLVGVSRRSLYDWLDNEEFRKEWDKRLQEIQTHGMSTLKATLGQNIANIILLATRAESEKVRLDANQYLIDRVLGKTTTKIDLEACAKESEKGIDDDLIDAELNDEE